MTADLTPEDIEARLAEALDAHQAGDRLEAGTLYADLRLRAPHNPTLLYLHGAFLFEEGDVDGADAAYEALAAIMPHHAEARRALARLKHWRGDGTRARDEYQAALAIEPNDAPTLGAYARLLLESGLNAEALAAAKQAVDIAPLEVSALIALALASAAEGANDAAITALETAHALAGPHEALEIAYLLGMTRLKLGEPALALAALERALALAPDHVGALSRLGSALFELKRVDEAEIAWRRALELDPASIEARTSLSSLLALAQRHEEAEIECRRVLELDPHQPVARQNLAALLEARGDLDGAKAERDVLYAHTRVVVEPAARAELTVLLLVCDGKGTVPHRDLLPRSRYAKINWFITQAGPDDWRDLPPYDVVFNAIGDADLAGPALAPTQAFLAACPGPVINLPERVMATDRAAVAEMLAGIDGLKAPRTARLCEAAARGRSLSDLAAEAGVSAPLLVRPIGSHGGHGLELVRAQSALEAAAAPQAQDFYLSEFVDFASPDGWHRKYRVIFVDRQPFAYHLAISQNWLVHYETARMGADAARKAEEARFLDDPEKVLGRRAWSALTEVGRRLDLDFAGIDFALLPSGEVLLFEANATMLVHEEDEDGPYAHKNAAARSICAAFQALVDAKRRDRR